MVELTEKEFEIIYNLYYKELFNIAFGYTRNKEDSEDIIQEAFLKFLKKQSKINQNEYKYWLIRVTINQSIDLLKSKKKIIIDENIILKIPNDTINNSNTNKDKLIILINRLPNKLKDVIILYYYDDLSVKDIAYTLNISESAVKIRLKRARDFLKEKMEVTND